MYREEQRSIARFWLLNRAKSISSSAEIFLIPETIIRYIYIWLSLVIFGEVRFDYIQPNSFPYCLFLALLTTSETSNLPQHIFSTLTMGMQIVNLESRFPESSAIDLPFDPRIPLQLQMV